MVLVEVGAAGGAVVSDVEASRGGQTPGGYSYTILYLNR